MRASVGGDLRAQALDWVRPQAGQVCPPQAALGGMGAGGLQHEGELMGGWNSVWGL